MTGGEAEAVAAPPVALGREVGDEHGDDEEEEADGGRLHEESDPVATQQEQQF